MQRFAWGDALPVAANVRQRRRRWRRRASLEAHDRRLPGRVPGRSRRSANSQPSPLGLQDMAGNVSEWVNDYYLSFVDATAATDPLGPEPAAQHVVRGANWRSAAVRQLRFAWRGTRRRRQRHDRLPHRALRGVSMKNLMRRPFASRLSLACCAHAGHRASMFITLRAVRAGVRRRKRQHAPQHRRPRTPRPSGRSEHRAGCEGIGRQQRDVPRRHLKSDAARERSPSS